MIRLDALRSRSVHRVCALNFDLPLAERALDAVSCVPIDLAADPFVVDRAAAIERRPGLGELFVADHLTVWIVQGVDDYSAIASVPADQVRTSIYIDGAYDAVTLMALAIYATGVENPSPEEVKAKLVASAAPWGMLFSVMR